ncbi:MAG: CCA tRNA nucleotidyltransferase [Alphaproteobacteria bacterium]|nr:CCA tRNA nucleotidyltransferase [Alphaproteobacteria bacterium]
MTAQTAKDAIGRLAKAPWLKDRPVAEVFSLLDGPARRTRAVGGIVRDTLLGLAAADIDFATELTPEEVTSRAGFAGISAHPTGIEHGTITLVIAGRPFQVTTLRQDIATDGRRAEVRFGTDWLRDASRRDFTMNALYCDWAGQLFDPLDGLQDCLSRTVRFIGTPKDRIAEDHLRILRFFRFFAVFGHGRPDAEALKASAGLKPALADLSAERIWGELKRILGAPDPARALLWMRTTGVLAQVLPEGEKWGIDGIHGLIETEKTQDWPPDPLLRLMAIVPPMIERIDALADRLKLSNAEHQRLADWARAPLPESEGPVGDLDRLLYEHNASGVRDRLALAAAGSISGTNAAFEAGAALALYEHARAFQRPDFPLKGKDLIALGYSPGPKLGAELARLEKIWIGHGFAIDRAALLARVAPADAKRS